jgi:predicted transposase YbfD/YdcC
METVEGCGRIEPIMAYFSGIPDPRKEINKRYPLDEVIAITILAVMSFAKGWEDIERYGKSKQEWLSKFLELKHGIPKHDVYRRVFTALHPELIEQCFMNWVRSIKKAIQGEIIAVDGKTVCGTFNAETGTSLHLVSAWATANRLVFGQVKTDEKSNEITAIPQGQRILLSLQRNGKIKNKFIHWEGLNHGNKGRGQTDRAHYGIFFRHTRPAKGHKQTIPPG